MTCQLNYMISQVQFSDDTVSLSDCSENYTHFNAQQLYTQNRRYMIYLTYLKDTAITVWYIADNDCKTKAVCIRNIYTIYVDI